MIKRPDENKTIVRILLVLLIMVVSIYSIFEVVGMEDEMYNSSPGMETTISLFLEVVYAFLLIILMGGGFIIHQQFDRRIHPEKYNYCKKCKHIIPKVKDIKFCGGCFEDIEQVIKYEKLLKYKKDFLKQKEKKK